MRAVQLQGPGDVAVGDVPRPAAGPGEVVLRVAAAGLCHSDLHVRHLKADVLPHGMVLGHEIAGTVVESGPGVPEWQEGDPAVVYLCWSCGRCRACVAGRENECTTATGRMGNPPCPGLGPDGGMAEYVAVPARHLVSAAGLDLTQAAPLADAGMTPYHAIRDVRGLLTPGATAVVIGVGGIGQGAVQIVRALTAARVIAIDLHDGRLALARSHGADLAIVADEHAAEGILGATDGRGADVVIDAVGTDATLRLATETVAAGGAIRMLGVGGGSIVYPAAPFASTLPWGVSLRLTYGGTRQDLADVLALARRGDLTIPTETFALDDAVVAMDRLEDGDVAGRAVLVP